MNQLILISLLLMLSCQSLVKTDNQNNSIQSEHEKKVLQKLEQLQINMANLQTQYSDVDSRLQSLNGKLSDIEDNKIQTQQIQSFDQPNPVSKSETPIKILSTQSRIITPEVIEPKPIKKLVEEKIKETPKPMMEEVSLKGMSTKQKLDKGKEEFQRNSFARANFIYTKIIENKEKISNTQLNQIHHERGISLYRLNHFEPALMELSQSYTQWPESSKAPSVLLHIAYSFKKLDKQNEYKEALKELINNFPNSIEAKTAKKEI